VTADQPTLVLIAGLLSDAIVWQPTADAIGATMPVVIADLNNGDTFTEIAQTILDANPGPLYVVGHSMGARIALEMVRLAAARIEKLALVDTGVHPLQDGEAAKRQVLLDLAADEGMAAVAARWLPPMVAPARRDDAAIMQPLTDMVLRADAAVFARQAKAMLARPEAAAVLARVACPVLLVVGREDAWSPVAQHEEMLAGLADAQLVVIEDAGHFAPLERPEAMIAALRLWIDGGRPA